MLRPLRTWQLTYPTNWKVTDISECTKAVIFLDITKRDSCDFLKLWSNCSYIRAGNKVKKHWIEKQYWFTNCCNFNET